MEEKKTVLPHGISWQDRKKGSITGVTNVHSFDENLVVLETSQGLLTLEQGEVELDGMIESMIYSGRRPETKGSLLRRMLR